MKKIKTYFFNKKVIILFSLLILFGVFFIVTKNFTSYFYQNTTISTDNNSNVQKIKSSCREIQVEKNDPKISLTRVQKLTKLMDTPFDWIFEDINGDTIDLFCYRGKKNIVINFWATWCSPCIKELASLSNLAKNNHDRVIVIVISTETKQRIQTFLKQSFSDLSSHLKVVQISNPEKLQHFPEDSLPVTYVFNKSGKLKFKELGDRNWSDPKLVQILRSFE